MKRLEQKNNVNWMNLLRLAFSLDPEKAGRIMSKINYDDKKISELLKKLSKLR